ncbi:MAG: hypothetical protein ABSH09_21745 [Bryobacteraceae bacterium]|jgi:hypothetical protein
MRSLHADGRSRRALWFLLLPVVVLGAWTTWLFEARVLRHETTDHARVDGTRIIAEFPPSTRIHPGQLGRFLIDGNSIPARVTRVTGQSVELAIDRSLAPQQGTVEVQVESLSPAAMLLRANRRAP